MSTAVTSRVLDPAGAARILVAAREADEGLGGFIRLALMAGARRGELVGIRWADLQWPAVPQETGALLIACPKGGKTPLACWEVALDPVTMRLLAEWRDVRRSMLATCGAELDDEDLVFTPGSPVRASRRVLAGAAQTGVSVAITALRRYSMTRLAALGVSPDVIRYRMGISIRGGSFPLFRSLSDLRAADREAALLLSRELDQAVTDAGHDG